MSKLRLNTAAPPSKTLLLCTYRRRPITCIYVSKNPGFSNRRLRSSKLARVVSLRSLQLKP